jgi:hypothetical protein
MRRPVPTQKLKLGLLILLAICIPLAARGEAQAPRFGFRAYDSSGTELRWERFRQVEENWKTTEGRKGAFCVTTVRAHANARIRIVKSSVIRPPGTSTFF